MKISILGSGYVGLVSGVCLSNKGHQVICVDSNQEKIDQINSGYSPIYEKGLDKLLRKTVGREFKATSDIYTSVKNTSVSIIAVGTPYLKETINLSSIKEVSEKIGLALKKKNKYHLVIVKSTVVPGTTDDIVTPTIEKYSGKVAGEDFGVGMNPEFLREGVAISDFMKPDRIVIGGNNKKTLKQMNKLYKVFDDTEIISTNNRTAEMIKYASNSLFGTLISFSNEIGNLCSSIEGVDSVDVMKGVHLDKRISPILKNKKRIRPGIISYLEAGCGFGGSCFPKDINALISFGKNKKNSMKLLSSVMDINYKQPNQIIKKILKHQPKLVGANIAILGLAFKPGTDDVRESPSISVINKLTKLGANVKAYDPVVKSNEGIFKNKNIINCDTLENTIKNSSVIVLMTSWSEFISLKNLLKKIKNKPLIVDGRRLLSKNDFEKYEGIGIKQ